MKKASIFNYHFQDFKHITGYDHNVEIPYDKVWDIAKDIVEKGLNVMIVHLNKEGDLVLYVDTKNFKQR